MQHSPPTIEKSDYTSLYQQIRQALHKNPTGINEYELLKLLNNNQHDGFKHLCFTDHVNLFQSHFLLFHTLYRLKDKMFASSEGILDISPLNIVLLSFKNKGSTEIAKHDPLRDYYLDLTNLYETSEEDVTELLLNFWNRLHATDQRESALAVLGLEDPVDQAMIKQQYRQLAMQHHPDRGGDTQQLQIINVAMETLERGYK